MSIELLNITKRYGAHVVLDDVTDEVPTGSMTALLGPSGSGKSTLLRVISGLTTAEQGRVVLHGRDVTTTPVRRRGIGFCFQDYAPFRHLTVRENVEFGLKVRRVRREARRRRARELLEVVRIGELEDRYPHQISGGQRQRMALARALAIEPDVLLLDEPFAALDAQVRGELRAWVRSLHHQLGITTILVTHDQGEAIEVADRLVILRDGRIEQVGAPADVYDRPANEFVRGFLGPTTTWRGVSVRPHDLEFAIDGDEMRVVDVVRLGFETRVTVAGNDGDESWVQLAHDEYERAGLRIGDRAHVRLRRPVSVPAVPSVADEA
jgi:sulfate transport system ATP-binding protein